MKKKLNKIAALVLALVMVITGFVAVPQMDVQAANDVPSFTMKTDVTKMKPGDTVHVELWLNEGPNIVEIIGPIDFDTDVYEYVDESLKTNSTLALEIINGGGQFMIDPAPNGDGFSVLIASMKKAFKGSLKLLEFDVKVKANAKGTGEMAFQCFGTSIGNSYDESTAYDEDFCKKMLFLKH